ncbi:MAG TPA: hypothetical protein VI358_18190 [Pseudolabrys sp.]
MKLGHKQTELLLIADGRDSKRITAIYPNTRKVCRRMAELGLFVQDGAGSDVFYLTDAGKAKAKEISDA